MNANLGKHPTTKKQTSPTPTPKCPPPPTILYLTLFYFTYFALQVGQRHNLVATRNAGVAVQRVVRVALHHHVVGAALRHMRHNIVARRTVALHDQTLDVWCLKKKKKKRKEKKQREEKREEKKRITKGQKMNQKHE